MLIPRGRDLPHCPVASDMMTWWGKDVTPQSKEVGSGSPFHPSESVKETYPEAGELWQQGAQAEQRSR